MEKGNTKRRKTMAIEPYLFFNGCCEEALEFYRTALNAEVLMTMRYKESPEAPPPGMVPAGWDDKIMHASLRVGDANIMASDGCTEGGNFQGFSLSLTAADEADARNKFNALSQGGQVQMPIGKTFWSPCFGMVTDRFGLGWMIGVEGAK
jgi:PhnB protein